MRDWLGPGEARALRISPVEVEVFPVPLIKNRYGKGRVRVMRIHREGGRHEVSQLNIKAMLEGDFARAYTDADNSTSVSTDTIKNVVNVVARENTGLCTEEFCLLLAKKYLDLYPQAVSVASRIRTVSFSTATVSHLSR
jgi:urate oxidase